MQIIFAPIPRYGQASELKRTIGRDVQADPTPLQHVACAPRGLPIKAAIDRDTPATLISIVCATVLISLRQRPSLGLASSAVWRPTRSASYSSLLIPSDLGMIVLTCSGSEPKRAPLVGHQHDWNIPLPGSLTSLDQVLSLASIITIPALIAPTNNYSH
jgi:hypothetical protein